MNFKNGRRSYFCSVVRPFAYSQNAAAVKAVIVFFYVALHNDGRPMIIGELRSAVDMSLIQILHRPTYMPTMFDCMTDDGQAQNSLHA